MKTRKNYKKHVIEITTFELRDGGYTAHFSIEEHDGEGVTDAYFTTGKRYETKKAAIDATLETAKRKIDNGDTITVRVVA
jgi:hypothetical protein